MRFESAAASRLPVAAAPVSDRALEPIGAAERRACADGRELWWLPPSRMEQAAELLELGRAGLGGFIEGGRESEQGGRVWLVREAIGAKLPALLGTHEGHPLAWRPVVELVASLAQALAAAEGRGVYPGLMRPPSVVIEPRPWLLADELVRARVGAEGRAEVQAALRREWLTPAAAAGHDEDASSNRWLLGLLAYRLLAGRGPFAGLGLRSAIDRLGQGVAPLPESVARELPPGLQSLILRILAPRPERRPASAAAIHEELRRFLDEGAVAARPAAPTPAAAPAALPPNSTMRFIPAGDAPARTHAPEVTGTPLAPELSAPAPPVSAPTHAPVPTPPVSAPRATQTPGPMRRRRARLFTRLRRGAVVAAVVMFGLVGAERLVELAGEAAPPTEPAKAVEGPKIGSRAPLDADHTRPEDCASCHPRQTAEWKRSVMGHSSKSPLFQGLEILIEEQVGRSDTCPGGAGALRSPGRNACIDPNTGVAITGSGGALWCVNCHTPRENLGAVLPAWDGLSSSSATRLPLRDLQPESTSEGIDCGFCHQVHGPVQPGNERRGLYEGNPSWQSTATGFLFSMRPEDRRGLDGISNSGYFLDAAELLVDAGATGKIDGRPDAPTVPGGVHRRPSEDGRAYLRSSQFCGACHDVRLFGSDAIGAPQRGEHFRRLRNAYSEWVDWAAREQALGREAASCQDCHMSSFPGVCVPGEAPAPVSGETHITALSRACPPGTRFESRAPGELPQLRVAAGSGERREVTTHYFSGVDIPLTPAFDEHFVDQPELDAAGIPLGGEQRRDLLLGRSFRFELGEAALTGRGRTLELPITIENTGAGHKIPAGFSQEREVWVHLRVSDRDGRTVYEVGRVERPEDDLRDKIFVDVNVDDRIVDGLGQPQGMFGADVVDGPDAPQWRALDARGRGEFEAATQFRGRGLINLQNGFLRCVQCIGFIDGAGRCQPANASQASHRAGRFVDGTLDIDTGECFSNLRGEAALFEIYFPVGSLDASRGVIKGPDAIIDVRSAPPGVPLRWTYELPVDGGRGPFEVEARLLFRAFPPFLVKAFADYEALQAARGLRPSGALVSREMLAKLEVVEIASVTRTLEL